MKSFFDCGEFAWITVLISVVVSQNDEFTGNPKEYGEHVTWNMTSKHEDPFLNSFVNDTDSERILYEVIPSPVQKPLSEIKQLKYLDDLKSVVVSQNVEFIGNPEVNGTYGKNVTITWDVKSKPKEMVFLIILDGGINSKKKILDKRVTILGRPRTYHFDEPTIILSPKMVKRVFATYLSEGKKDSNGMITGQVYFTITNLTFNDDGRYTVASVYGEEYDAFDITTLSVFSPPKKCGAVLEEKYVVKQGQQLPVTSGFCGKPQPTVTCSLNEEDYGNPIIAKVSEHNYNYTITLPKNLKPCTTKDIVCVVANYDKSFLREIITVRGAPKEKTIATGKCAGYIIGFVIGVIVFCVFVSLCVVKWNSTTDCGKLGFIVALIFGLALIIALLIAYAGLRHGEPKCPIESTLMTDCDTGFIVCGVIEGVGLIVVIIFRRKIKKGLFLVFSTLHDRFVKPCKCTSKSQQQ